MLSRFLFPFELVPAKSKVIIYGAGECGQAFYNQIRATGYCEVANWIDKNADEARQNFGIPVYPPNKINDTEFDYIVIAISNENIKKEACHLLASQFGIPSDKFITEVIDLVLHRAVKSWGEYAFIGKDRNKELEEIAPAELVTHNRLDVAVRWLLCRDFLYGIKNDSHLSLYTRMQLARVQGIANGDFWTDNPKTNVDEMVAECKKLCLSISENGFNRQYPVPLSSKNNTIIDGSHRLSAALAAEKNIWIKYYGNVLGGGNYNFSWFSGNGFNHEDLISILRGYCEISIKPLGLAILYGTVIDQWDFISAALRKSFTEVGFIDLDFSGNFYSFETLIREIYYDASYKNPYNDFKLKFLEKAPLKIKVILLEEDESQKNDIPFYEALKRLKNTLRSSMFFDTADAPCVFHTSDDRFEFNTLKKLFLSVNNIHYLEKRITTNYSDALLERLDKAKKLLKKLGIPIDDCVIAGSTPLEVLGLITARDLDIIIHSRHRDIIPPEMQEIGQEIEICVANKIRAGISDDFINNDNLVIDDNLHFIFNGWKMVNLEILKTHIKWHIDNPFFMHVKEKNENRLRRIELFEDFVLHFDDKAALREQIKKEYFRKRFS